MTFPGILRWNRRIHKISIYFPAENCNFYGLWFTERYASICGIAVAGNYGFRNMYWYGNTNPFPRGKPLRLWCFDTFQKPYFFVERGMVKPEISQICHSEEGQSPDVGISSSAPEFCRKLLNIEYLRYTMLIGASKIEASVLEIATSLRSSQWQIW